MDSKLRFFDHVKYDYLDLSPIKMDMLLLKYDLAILQEDWDQIHHIPRLVAAISYRHNSEPLFPLGL